MPVMGASLLRWIDRQYDSPGGYIAKYALLVIAGSPWLCLLLFGMPTAAVAFAAAWSIFWTGLFLWRAGPWLKRLGRKWEKRRRR